MENREFYIQMIEMYGSQGGLVQESKNKKDIIESILRYIKLDLESAYTNGKVAGMERANEIRREILDKN
jgi:hypothetical protein